MNAAIRHVVMMSGGIGSWATAKRVIDEQGPDEVVLLFADTKVEDPDLYRFLNDAAAQLGARLVTVADGRTPWEVFRDRRIIGNSRIAPCSQYLKQIPCRRWLEENTDPAQCAVYVGIDWTETHRLPAIQEAYRPWTALAPLCEPPYLDKQDLIRGAEARGLRPPRLYAQGFPHNNCGGACVRGGQAQWALLHETNPARFADEERQEQQMRAELGKDVAILRERVDGATRPLPLIELRSRITRGTTDTGDWGGCGCFTEPTANDPEPLHEGGDSTVTTQPVDSADMWAGLSQLEPAQPLTPMWDDPAPLKGPRALADFPTHALPSWLRDFVAAVAEETQTPVDLAGSIALSVLATAAGGRSVVQVRGSWREPTNLYVVVALPPANRKSAVFALLSDPLFDAEERLREASGPAIVEAQMTARLAKEAADNAASKAAKAAPDERDALVESALALAQTAESVKVPVEPQLLADDATAETVTSRLAEQGDRISVMSAEGEIFDIMAGRYTSGGVNLGVFLKGHAGDRLRVDRQTRKEYIENPAVTMGICVQPQVLEAIGRNEAARGRGLLGRFLYSLPESLVGYRKSEPDPIPDDIKATYHRNIIDLTLALADWTDPAVLQLAPDAHTALVQFQDRVEPKLRQREGSLGHISDWAGKVVGATARIAGLLHLAEHLENGHTVPVSQETMRGAIELGEYFTSHGLAAFDAMGADQTADRATSLLETLRAHGWGEFSKRDLMLKVSRSEFPTADALDPALGLLEDHGYVRALPVQRSGGRGRPPSPRYLTHPRLSTPTH